MRYFLCLLVAFLCKNVAFGQSDDFLKTTHSKTLQNSVRFHFLHINKTPHYDMRKNMGLLGLSYKVDLGKNVYGGIALHKAIAGDQGGLFTIGTFLGTSIPISKKIKFDSNFYFGGGGGYRSLVNHGGYINTNLGLSYKFQKTTFGLQYSYFDFYTGIIEDNSISFFIEFDAPISVSKYNKPKQTFTLPTETTTTFKKSTFTLRTDHFLPIGNSRKDGVNNFDPLNNLLYLIGFEYQKYLNKNTFIFAHTDAVYKGLTAGFMDFFVGLGEQLFELKNIKLNGRFAFGAAGGRIIPEGGATLYPSINLDIDLSPHIAIATHGGYLKALDGGFEAYSGGIGLKYKSFTGGYKNTFNSFETKKITSKRLRLSLQNQIYFKTPRNERSSIDIDLISMQFNYELNKYLYLTAHTAFAYGARHKYKSTHTHYDEYTGAGGYADASFGIGIQTNVIGNRIQFFTEFLGGVGGGAEIKTGEGLLAKGKIGGSIFLSPDVALIASAGKVYSPFTNLNIYNLNFGLQYQFATINSFFKKN